MISNNERLAEANKSYLMEVAKTKTLEGHDALSYQSTTDEDYQFLDSWKANKLKRLRNIYEKRREYLDKGAGNLEIVTEEKELINITKDNPRVICHFYEEGFERCNLLDRLLTSLASRFLDTKFVKIKATNSPFFTDRIGIKVLPTLLTLIEGNIAKIYVGFEEFGRDNINLNTLRSTLCRHKILTDECCILDGNSEGEEESDPNN
ncbi:hypothetical protein MACK_002469 [Theileria orientalis]|uniref:Phosducin domain-containing protein n=1 Tax=Theileria orientalis TaxID=68886 RepID=A0A976MCB0_THEOR|nr:hypothetical protein MACK_002469 [Theileria orientalis]